MEQSGGLLNGVNIAFIDDQRYGLTFYIDRLTRAGATVYFYDNIGDAATAIDGGKTFDAVILDLMMPPNDIVSEKIQAEFNSANGLYILTKQNLAAQIAARQTALLIFTHANELLPNWCGEQSPVTLALRQANIDPALPHIEMRRKLGLSAKNAPEAVYALLRHTSRAA